MLLPALFPRDCVARLKNGLAGAPLSKPDAMRYP